MKNKQLFESLQLAQAQIKNRVAVAPMTRVSASAEGYPGDRMHRYYEDFAKGGFGLIISEGLFIDSKWSQTYSFQAGIATTEHALAWRPIVESVHAGGAKIFAQIQHSGALSQGNPHIDGTVGPSAIQPKGVQMKFYRGEGPYRIPASLTQADLENIISSFAEAAKIATSEAGFDGVEIHGANGYLLDQFLTDYTNTREDKWGGDTTSRMTLILEVIKAVRLGVGSKSNVGIRISQAKVNDYFHKWAGGEADARIVFELLAKSGVDYVHITEFEAWKPAFPNCDLSLVALARKYAPNLVIIANGNLHDPSRAEQVLRDGADIIALGRGALANHDWPKLVDNGEKLREFDPSILGPIADVKDSELPSPKY